MKLGIYHKEGLTGLLEQDFPQLSPQIGGAAVDVYVSPLGSTNGKGTKASPWASPDDVLANLPIFLLASATQLPQINIHYADSLGNFDDTRAGGLPVYSATALQQAYVIGQLWLWNTTLFQSMFTHRGPQMVRAVGLASGPTIVAVGNVKTLSTPAGTTKTRMTFGTSPAWTAHNLKGRFARFINSVSGNQTIYECPISDNAANSIDLDCTTVNTPLTADLANMTVEICDPGFQLAGNSAQFGGFDVVASPFSFEFSGAQVERCFLNGLSASTGATYDRCLFSSGSGGNGNGWGFFNCTVKTDGAAGTSGFVLRNGSTGGPVTPRADTASSPEDQANSAGVDIIVYKGLYLGMIESSDTWTPLIYPFFFTAWRNVSVYDAGSNGINIGLKSMFRTSPQQPFPLQASKVSVQGSGIAASAWRAQPDGLAIFDSPSATPGLISISGTQADVALQPELAGTPNGIRYGTGAGQFEEATGWKGNYTHVLSATDPTHVILGSTARVCTRAYAQ